MAQSENSTRFGENCHLRTSLSAPTPYVRNSERASSTPSTYEITAFVCNYPLLFVIPPAPACCGSEADLSRRAVEESAVLRTLRGNVFLSILNRNAEPKLLHLDGIFSLALCKQAGLFGHFLRFCAVSQPLISPAELVISRGIVWVKLQHLLEFIPRRFPLLQLHVEEPQLVVRFDHRPSQLLGTFQRFQCLLLLAQLQRNQAKNIFKRKITRDDAARFSQYLERLLIVSLFHIGLRQSYMS